MSTHKYLLTRKDAAPGAPSEGCTAMEHEGKLEHPSLESIDQAMTKIAGERLVPCLTSTSLGKFKEGTTVYYRHKAADGTPLHYWTERKCVSGWSGMYVELDKPVAVWDVVSMLAPREAVATVIATPTTPGTPATEETKVIDDFKSAVIDQIIAACYNLPRSTSMWSSVCNPIVEALLPYRFNQAVPNQLIPKLNDFGFKMLKIFENLHDSEVKRNAISAETKEHKSVIVDQIIAACYNISSSGDTWSSLCWPLAEALLPYRSNPTVSLLNEVGLTIQKILQKLHDSEVKRNAAIATVVATPVEKDHKSPIADQIVTACYAVDGRSDVWNSVARPLRDALLPYCASQMLPELNGLHDDVGKILRDLHYSEVKRSAITAVTTRTPVPAVSSVDSDKLKESFKAMEERIKALESRATSVTAPTGAPANEWMVSKGYFDQVFNWYRANGHVSQIPGDIVRDHWKCIHKMKTDHANMLYCNAIQHLDLPAWAYLAGCLGGSHRLDKPECRDGKYLQIAADAGMICAMMDYCNTHPAYDSKLTAKYNAILNAPMSEKDALAQLESKSQRSAPSTVPSSTSAPASVVATGAIATSVGEEKLSAFEQLKTWYDTNNHLEQISWEEGCRQKDLSVKLTAVDRKALLDYATPKIEIPMFANLAGCMHLMMGTSDGRDARYFEQGANAGLLLAMKNFVSTTRNFSKVGLCVEYVKKLTAANYANYGEPTSLAELEEWYNLNNGIAQLTWKQDNSHRDIIRGATFPELEKLLERAIVNIKIPIFANLAGHICLWLAKPAADVYRYFKMAGDAGLLAGMNNYRCLSAYNPEVADIYNKKIVASGYLSA